MAKSTKAGGLSGWPTQPEGLVGTDSSASTEQQEQSSKQSEQQSQSPAPTTDGPSDSEQTESSSVPSMGGGQTDETYEANREGVDDVGAYDTWLKEDLQSEASRRGLSYTSKMTNPQLIELLREDDATAPL